MSKEYAKSINQTLMSNGIRSIIDEDDRLRPGEKFYKWEMNGVYLERRDGTQLASADIAINKAKGALLFKRSSKILEDTGLFEVRVTEEVRGAGPETFAPYDLPSC